VEAEKTELVAALKRTEEKLADSEASISNLGAEIKIIEAKVAEEHDSFEK